MIETIGKIYQTAKNALDFNSATLSGSCDIIVVRLNNGKYQSTPFHCRIGKFKIFKSQERIVSIYVNQVQQIPVMHLNDDGECYFYEEKLQKNPSRKKKFGSEYLFDYQIDTKQDQEKYNADLEDDKSKTVQSKNQNTEKLNSTAKKETRTQDIILTTNKKNDINVSQQEKQKGSGFFSLFRFFKGSNKNSKNQNNTFSETPQQENDQTTKRITAENDLELNSKFLEENQGEQNIIIEVENKEIANENDFNIEEAQIQKASSYIVNFEQDQGEEAKESMQILNEDDQQINSNRSSPLQKLNQKDFDNDNFQLNNIEQNFSNQNDNLENDEHEEHNNAVLNINRNQIFFSEKKIYDQQNFENDSNDAEYEEEEKDEDDENEEEEDNVELSLCKDEINKNIKGDLNEIFEKHKISYEKFVENPNEILNNKKLLVKVENKLYGWNIAAPLIISLLVYKKPLPKEILENLCKEEKKGLWKRIFSKSKPKNNGKNENILDELKDLDEKQQSNQLSDDQQSFSSTYYPNGNKKYKKSKNLNSEQLEAFKLHEGRNTIEFEVTSRLYGTSRLRAHIYLWNEDDQIVISDIDGTMTKTDIFGQLLPMVGKEWVHDSVVPFFNNIAKNNYKFLYVTARAIGQADQTRNFLTNFSQNGQSFPEGPIIMQPKDLYASFKNEIIYKKPHVFKIGALRKIQALYQKSPYYCAFGNKDTDAIAYRSVDIPEEKIFIINPKSQIHLINNNAYIKSYAELNQLVNYMFPPVKNENSTKSDEQYNNYHYWSCNLDKQQNVDDLMNELL